MKWVKVCCLSLIVSLGVVKMTWGEEPELSWGCYGNATSFGLVMLAKTFVEAGTIDPPGADGFFSYDAMGILSNSLYKNPYVGALMERITQLCLQLGTEPVNRHFDAALGITYAERKQAWASYKRTPAEYRKKHYQEPVARTELSVLSCKAQARSFGLAVIARAFVKDGVIDPPGADGFFSYDAMGYVDNFLYKRDGTGSLFKTVKVMCREQGKLLVNSRFEASLGVTYAERKQAWASYKRTPKEYLAKHYQTRAEYKLHGLRPLN